MSLRLSKSKISTYVTCPLKYKYSYIDKLPYTESYYEKKGSFLHSAFEKFNKRRYFPKEQVLEAAEKFECKEQMDNFLSFNEKIAAMEGQGTFLPIATEKKFYDKEMDLVGVIDAIYSTGNSVLILDYKTGKVRLDKVTHNRFQLAIYKHLWDKFNPERKATHWGILFTQTGYLWKEKVSERTMKAMYKKVERVRDKIMEGNYLPKYSPMCKWCSFKNLCFGKDW